jgi:hypothetical protein
MRMNALFGALDDGRCLGKDITEKKMNISRYYFGMDERTNGQPLKIYSIEEIFSHYPKKEEIRSSSSGYIHDLMVVIWPNSLCLSRIFCYQEN